MVLKAIKPHVMGIIEDCLDNGRLYFQKDLEQFERHFAEFCGIRYGVGTGSCTGALHIALRALEVGPGNEVITVAHTYVATVDVIKACGATPILIDVNLSDHLMDMTKVEEAITYRKQGGNIVLVHEFDFWDAVEDAS